MFPWTIFSDLLSLRLWGLALFGDWLLGGWLSLRLWGLGLFGGWLNVNILSTSTLQEDYMQLAQCSFARVSHRVFRRKL
jgi:hypothetical protein